MTPDTRTRVDALLLERAELEGIIRSCRNLRLKLRLRNERARINFEIDGILRADRKHEEATV